MVWNIENGFYVLGWIFQVSWLATLLECWRIYLASLLPGPPFLIIGFFKLSLSFRLCSYITFPYSFIVDFLTPDASRLHSVIFPIFSMASIIVVPHTLLDDLFGETVNECSIVRDTRETLSNRAVSSLGIVDKALKFNISVSWEG